MNPNEEAVKMLTESYAKLKGVANEHPESIADVGVEGMTHIMENFVIPAGRLFDNDNCFVMFNAFIGMDKKVEHNGVYAMSVYTAGNRNMIAHQLAEFMRIDNKVREIVFHAMYAFQTGSKA